MPVRRADEEYSSLPPSMLAVCYAIANILDCYSLAQVSEVFRNKLCYDGKIFLKNNVDLFSW